MAERKTTVFTISQQSTSKGVHCHPLFIQSASSPSSSAFFGCFRSTGHRSNLPFSLIRADDPPTCTNTCNRSPRLPSFRRDYHSIRLNHLNSDATPTSSFTATLGPCSRGLTFITPYTLLKHVCTRYKQQFELHLPQSSAPSDVTKFNEFAAEIIHFPARPSALFRVSRIMPQYCFVVSNRNSFTCEFDCLQNGMRQIA